MIVHIPVRPRRVRVRLFALATGWWLAAGGLAEAGIKPEFALHRPSTGRFFFNYQDGSPIVDRAFQFGIPNDVALLADFDGDTIADVALFRSGVWLIDLMNDGTVNKTVSFGDPGGPDIPIAGDFLGNGRAGIGVFRNGLWFLSRLADGTLDRTFGFGAAGDRPLVADFNADGVADCAVYRPSSGWWFVSNGCSGGLSSSFALGGLPGDRPFAGDFAATDHGGDWRAGIGIYRNGTWFISFNHDGVVDRVFYFGATGDRPLVGPLNPGGSLFVRQGASGGNGSQASPFGTIPIALSNLVGAGTIRIAAGTYPEPVLCANRSTVTFLGAGAAATHLTGSSDAFVAVLSTDITLRNLHVASPSDRAIIAQGASLNLDRVSTVGNRNHNVLGVNWGATGASLLIQHSNIDQSQIGNGLRLEGGVTATVQDSTIDDNGTALTPQSASTSGRGIEMFNDSVLTLETSSVSDNFFGGVLLTSTAHASIGTSQISRNGHNGVAFDANSSGDVFGNLLDYNGVRGSRGATTGFNGIEVQPTWTGSSVVLHENQISNSTTNGIFIGRGTVTVANNAFFNNFVQLTVDASGGPAAVTARGNYFQLPVVHTIEVGIFLNNGPTAILGGLSPDTNTFRDFGSRPSVLCSGSPSAATTCPGGASGNIFINSSLHNLGCTCPL